MSAFRLSTSPALRLALLAIIGIRVAQWVPVPLAALVTALGLLTLIATLCLFRTSSHRLPALIPGLVAPALCILCGAIKFTVDSDRAMVVPDAALAGQAILIGTVTEPPVIATNVIRFVLKAREVRTASGAFRTAENVRVSVTRHTSDTTSRRVEYGTVLALNGRLSRPTDSRNPGDFSEKQYYEANGITLFMLVRGGGNAVVLDSLRGSRLMAGIVVPVRTYVLRMLEATMRSEASAFLKGLMIGDRSGIEPQTRLAFTNSGVAHVLAVSGSNVAVVAGVFFFLFGMLRFPKWAVVTSSIVMILLYMLVTGSQPPVVRATITASIFLIASLVQTRSNPFNSLGIAALIILALDARQLFDVGFQLSFVAVLSIVSLYPKMNVWITTPGPDGIVRRTIIWTLRVCAVSLAASLGTLPLTAIYFAKVSIIGLLANIVVIPAAGAAVVLGFVTVAAGLVSNWIASGYAAVNQLLLDCTLWLIRLAGDAPFAYADTSRFLPVYAIPFYAALLFFFNVGVRHVARRLFIILLLTLNVAVVVPPPFAVATSGKLLVSFLDVGQGDAAVVELPDGKTIVIDAGPGTGTYDAGERIVAPFLRRRGISRIDMLVMSHPHEDHLGGMPSILEQFDVASILESGQPARSGTYAKYINGVRSEGCIVDTARSGMPALGIGDLRFYVLFPTPSFIDTDTAARHPNLNNTSVVFRMQYGDVSFLFTGDAEEEAEEEMVNRYGDFLECSLLKTGHHGSRTSSTGQFLEVVRPAYAVISVGQFNKFRHPSNEVITRLHALRTEIHRTDEEGAIIFESDGRALSRVDWR